MTEQHPITPPPERFKQWEDDILNERDNVDHVLDCAWRDGFRAGADQELEKCCEWMLANARFLDAGWIERLRTARRPKPQSLKERAMSEVASAMARGNITPERGAIIRLALEQLDD